MLTVTANAKEKFKEILQERDTDPGVSIRIISSSSKSNMFDLVLDKEKEGDQVVENEEGIKILLIGPDVASALEGKVIDYRKTPQGAGFTLT